MERIISIVGSNSFLASRFIQYIKLHVTFPVAFNLYGSIDPKLEHTAFHYYRLPQHPLNVKDLLDSDLILYCAGAGVQSSKKYERGIVYEVNAFEPIRIINELNIAGYKGKIVTFGSYFEIGSNNEQRLYTEIDVVNATAPVPNDYCLSKRILTRFFESNRTSLKWYHLILSSIYGKGENANRLIPYVVTGILSNQKIKLSAGDQVRQYIHADDVNTFIISLSEKEIPSGMYNLAPEEGLTVKELVETIQFILNKKALVHLGDLTRTDQSMKVLLLNTDKIKKTGWKSSVSLTQGITEYIQI